jgi:high-affinity nickel-transport protein
VVAVVVGAIEALGLVVQKLGLVGGLWDTAVFAAGNFYLLGYLAIGAFDVCWFVSLMIYRALGYHKIGSA